MTSEILTIVTYVGLYIAIGLLGSFLFLDSYRKQVGSIDLMGVLMFLIAVLVWPLTIISMLLIYFEERPTRRE